VTTLQEGVQRVNDEAGGMLTVQVIQQHDMPAMIAGALGGSAEAMQLLRLTNQVLANIQGAPRRKPMLCGCCPRALRGGRYAVIIARPACDDPAQGLSLAICRKCGPDFDAIQVKATVALARIWPNVRPVTVTHPEGGRA
jgi:hypothetical protein